MTITLPDTRSLNDDLLEALRLRALHACELGFAEADIAAILGVSRETVSRWWSAYADGGVDALPHQRRGRPVGSGRLLSDDQERHLQQLLDQHTPPALGIAQPLWTRRAVHDLIQHEYGLDLPLRTVGQYLRRWGFRPKRPARKGRPQDPEEVRRWLEETYPAVLARAARAGGEIYWCDEVGVGLDTHSGRGYARAGQTPVKEVTGGGPRVNAIAAITNYGEAHFLTFPGTLDTAAFLVFLQLLLQETKRKVFLILDNLAVHDSAEVKEWLAWRADRIELIPLPRYAPERNPTEYLNNDVKEEVNAEGLPTNEQELHSHLDTFLQKLAYWPERIMSYFRHPSVQYAAATIL
jgi:transposase